MIQTSREGLARVGVYERELPVSGERVWENIRDWEHLPWLHSGSFASIDLVEEGDWGWRARIGSHNGSEILLELVIDSAEAGALPRYVSRTVEGPGAGTEIWTEVDERGDAETHVCVEFWVPEASVSQAGRAAALGERYVGLYTQLWDEDESMMAERSRAMAARRASDPAAKATVVLGALTELRSRLPLVVRFGGESFRIVELDGRLVAHSAICPHLLGPLDAVDVEDGRVVCPWHGYQFDVGSGEECSGRRLKLRPPPRVLVDPEQEQVYLDSPE